MTRIAAHSRAAIGLFLALSACGFLASPATPAKAREWRASPIWDDGNAEFCAYEVDWPRYGEMFPGSARLILVKEPWAPDLDVKADRARPNGFDVLKLNHVRDVPTGIYTYHQMASVYLRRDSGALRKLSVTSSEACGISTAHVVDGRLDTRSYFDGQGEATGPYPEGALPEEGLAASLRDHLDGELPGTLAVTPSFMNGSLPEPAPAVFRLSRSGDRRSVPAGEREVTVLRLEGDARWLEFAFDRTPPHPLVELRQSDGTHYRLSKCERIPYWNMNRPGGEEWLPEAVR